MQSDTQALNIYCDGGSRGNPGQAAVGIVVRDGDGKILYEFGEKIGVTTNNVAEYTAVIKALEFLKNRQMRVDKINFYLDSRLVVSQLSGIFKIKNNLLFSLFLKVNDLERDVSKNIIYTAIPREKNQRADYWVNSVLDGNGNL